MNKLSIVIPAYNEKNTIEAIIKKVKAVDLGGLEKEIIIVDDGSKDGTREILRQMPGIRLILHEKNLGKGGAIKTGFQNATGDILIIQDADLEYDPQDYKKILSPILNGQADVVYGSRFLTSEPKRVLFIWHFLGNISLTLLSDLLTGLTLTDMETCYKAFRKEVVDSFKDKIKSRRFGIEPELTALAAKGKWRIYEVGISYYGRTYKEGKKIGWRDGFAAIWHIIRFNLFN
ncbi:MAG: glycosyltransferase family 2 protein [Patescibacteria group bacterium]